MTEVRAVAVRRLALMALFVGVTLGYALFRQSSFYIFNDSAEKDWAIGGEVSRIHADRLQLAEHPLAEISKRLQTFGHTTHQGYRPANAFYQYLAITFLYEPSGPRFWQLLIVGSLYGALAVSMFLVTRRFVESELAAGFGVLLLLASPPLAATSWIFVVGAQVIIPLLFCLGLVCYWKTCESRYWVVALAGLLVILLVGPWVREIFFVFPMLIVFLEWQRSRRLTWLLGVSGAAVVHAIFPTALMKLLLFPDLPLRPMFALGGSVGTSIASAGIRWHAPWCFLPLFPPLLWVVAAIGSLVEAGHHVPGFLRIKTRDCHSSTRAWGLLTARHRNALTAVWRNIAAEPARSRNATWSLLSNALPVFVILLAAAMFLVKSSYLGLLLALGPAVLAVQQGHWVLAFWFLALFVPLLRVYTEHIHFLYALVPASIVMARAVECLWLRLRSWKGGLVWCRTAFATVCLLIALDQALNLGAAYQCNHATYQGIMTVAARLKEEVPAGSYVVINVNHGYDIWWHSRNHFQQREILPDDRIRPKRISGFAANSFGSPALKELLDRPENSKVYCLDVDFDYLPDKDGHRHPWVHRLAIDKVDLGVIHEMRGRYLFLDPLRHLVSREFVPFMGAPDLVNGFYCGPEQDGRPFTYEVHARYHLYEVARDSSGNHLISGGEMTPSRSVR